MTPTQAPDHFSVQAAAYKDFRPTYPAAFFDWLAHIAPSSALAWDCGCGNGQATADLARRFGRVIGTDLSRKQLDLAAPAVNVEYRCEAAEHSTIAAASVDLTLVAQALHWFDHASFYDEVRRVSKKDARLVALTYNLLQVTPAIDELIGQLYWETLRGYWPAGREHVENGYRDIPFPFKRLASPVFSLHADWSLHHLFGYFGSWSAIAAYRKKNGRDPLEPYRPAFQAAWGDPHSLKPIAWPLSILAGVVA
jgi:SAM-dependent methyltransferase